MKMCKKLPNCARYIDPCIAKEVLELQNKGIKTYSSCCGHGEYKKTIVILNEKQEFIEYFSNVYIKDYNRKYDKRHNRIYKKDENGFYFIEVVENWKALKMMFG